MMPPILAALAEDLTAADVLDLVTLAVLAIGALVGALRGLSGELARIAALAASGIACWTFSAPWRRLCAGWFPESALASGTAILVGVLACAVLVGWIVRKLVDKGLRVLVPQPANAILGLLAGLASLFLLVAAIVYLLHLLPFEAVQDKLLAPSRTWQAIAPLFGW